MKIAWSLAIALTMTACASSQTGSPENCRQRAQSQYQLCLNPQFVTPGDEATLTTSDQQQACRTSYQQALTACSGGSGTAKTSTVTDPFRFE